MMRWRRYLRWSVMVGLALVLGGGLAQTEPAGAIPTVSGRALVWQVGGTPGNPQGLGTLFWHTPGEQSAVNLHDVPNEGAGTRVFACGADAVSRDGTYLIAYIGAWTGGLYRVALTGETGDAALIRWGDAHALACNGRGNAGFSPDGARWAYINFERDAAGSNFPDGTLRILNATDGSEQAHYDNVIAFDLQNDGAYYVQFYTDSQGRADEMTVNRWDGASSRELAALNTDEGCFWTNARLAARPGGDPLFLAAGESCVGGSRWRVFSLTPDGGATERVYLPSGGAFLADSYSNQIAYLPGGQYLLAAYPNGRFKNIVNLVMVTPTAAGSGVTLIGDGVVVDTFPNGRAEHTRFAPGGGALAYVTTTTRDEQAINLLRLDGGVTPITISGGPRGEGITTFFFTPDGARLLYVAGGLNGADNALYALAVDDYNPDLVARGNFLPGGGVAGEDVALLLQRVPPDDSYRDPAVDLVAVSLTDGSKTVLVEGRVAQAWAYPLAWRPD